MSFYSDGLLPNQPFHFRILFFKINLFNYRTFAGTTSTYSSIMKFIETKLRIFISNNYCRQEAENLYLVF